MDNTIALIVDQGREYREQIFNDGWMAGLKAGRLIWSLCGAGLTGLAILAFEAWRAWL